jgi:hypothetical protein
MSAEGLADWRIGGLADWRIGGLADWRIGGLADWRIGNVASGGRAEAANPCQGRRGLFPYASHPSDLSRGPMSQTTIQRNSKGDVRKVGLGYLVFDPATKVFTRFDLVALGNLRGYPVGANLMGARDGENPLGIAFELVTRPTPADLVSPKGLMDGGGNYNLQHYLGSAK